LKRGHTVNLETDVIGKYVQRYLEHIQPAAGLTMAKLQSAFGGI
jgi:riboflavin synthase alpha subunit